MIFSVNYVQTPRVVRESTFKIFGVYFAYIYVYGFVMAVVC